MADIVMTLDEVGSLSRRALLANGASSEQAEAVAKVVEAAEADECRSHGIYRLPGYVAALRSGRANGAARPSVTAVTPSLIRVDGDRGFAPLASEAGRSALIAAARANGMAAMAIGNSHHFSALWADMEPLVEAGLVCWTFVVGQCSVAPWGGTQRLMGTNPIGFGWPRADGRHYIFDFATSAVARGEVELRMQAGETLPEGWAIGKDGAPTTDPAIALDGALLPFGGYKGSALSMMVELIAGPMIGEMTSRKVADLGIADGGPPPGGQLYMAFDPRALSPSSDWKAAAEEFFADARRQAGLRLPSDRRHEARTRTRAGGVTVPAALIDRIEALCATPAGFST